MCDTKNYVSVSVKANVYDWLYKISRNIVPGAALTVPKTIEILTNTYKDLKKDEKEKLWV
jgi:hypothetical protein